MLIGVGVYDMFVINPKHIKSLNIYLASPEFADYLLHEYGMTLFCYIADDLGNMRAGFRMTEELLDILKEMPLDLGKE